MNPELLPEARTQETMRFIVERLAGEVGRTQLVKLMYLADLEARRYLGRPITGMNWTRDNFGPFDSTGFYAALEALKKAGRIVEEIVAAPVGQGYEYSGAGQLNPTTLGSPELAVLSYVLQEYGKLPRQRLVEDIVYETAPFKRVKDSGRGTPIPMEIVDNEMRRQLGGISLEEVLIGEEEIRCGRFVTLDDLRCGMEGSDTGKNARSATG